MRKIICTLALSICSTLVFAKPVQVKMTYTDIQSLSNKMSVKQCRALLPNGKFVRDRDNTISFKAASGHYVKNSHTVIRAMDGRDVVLVKLGKSIIVTKRGKVTVNRISYVNVKPNGDATGQLVLVGLCKANFASARV